MQFNNYPNRVRDKVRFRLRRQFRPAPHFHINAAGAEFIYCYIRKNACSAFKKLIVEHSQHRNSFSGQVGELTFLKKYHRVKSKAEISTYKHIIFIYRDPIERVASLFRNKFIMMDRNSDIFDSYRHVTGQNPETATFNEFVTLYLCQNMKKLDPHCRPQYAHLLPIRYTNAIPMRALYPTMTQIVGQEIADSYFKEKTNSSGGTEYSEAASSTPAYVAHERWRRTHNVPSFHSLLTDHTERILKQIYVEDLMMIAMLDGN